MTTLMVNLPQGLTMDFAIQFKVESVVFLPSVPQNVVFLSVVVDLSRRVILVDPLL